MFVRRYFAAVPSYYRDPAAPEPNVPRKTRVTAVITRGDKVLVERRVDDAEVWAFIAGTLGESDGVLDTLHREVQEETGFDVASASLLGIFSEPERIAVYPDGTVCRVLSLAFRVTVHGDADPLLSYDSAGMQFVRLDELAGLPFWPIHLPIREALLGDPATPVVA